MVSDVMTDNRAVVVMKFGGVMVETPEKIKAAAEYIISVRESGKIPVVVVSAPGKTTDDLIKLARQVTNTPAGREMDMLLTVGERITMSLLAMAINSNSPYRALSFTGSQIGIITDSHHTDAKILEVKGYRIHEAIASGEIPIVAGFQGVSLAKEITTLGRGGSDATAIALAAALGAEKCELIKEHGGVYSADPEIVDDAVIRNVLGWDTLQSLVNAGAKVVQSKAASLAHQNQMPIELKSIHNNISTLVKDFSLSDGTVAGIVHKNNLVLRTVSDLDELQLTGSDPFIIFSDGKWQIFVKQDDMKNEDLYCLLSIIGFRNEFDISFLKLIRQLMREILVEPKSINAVNDRIAIITEQKHSQTLLQHLHSRLKVYKFIQ